MKERTMQKTDINIPLDWALNQILYSYDTNDTGINKSDVVSAAIRFHKGKVVGNFISKKLQTENPRMTPQEFKTPELTSSGRRQLLHINIPVELFETAQSVSQSCGLSMTKTISYMLHRLYDSDVEVTPTPRARKAGSSETTRVAINFPVSLVAEMNTLHSADGFRNAVIRAVEEYVRRNKDGRSNGTTGLGS